MDKKTYAAIKDLLEIVTYIYEDRTQDGDEEVMEKVDVARTWLATVQPEDK